MQRTAYMQVVLQVVRDVLRDDGHLFPHALRKPLDQLLHVRGDRLLIMSCAYTQSLAVLSTGMHNSTTALALALAHSQGYLVSGRSTAV